MRAHDKRLGRIRQAIGSSPVRRHLLEEAYGWFKDFGELPDDNDHLAYQVVQRALRGGEEALEDEFEVSNHLRHVRYSYDLGDRPAATWPPSVRALLFDEALYEPEPLRKVARAAIASEVTWGGDVENRAFAARHGIPGFGSVAMHVLGWLPKLAVPPYEDQAKRLFVRLDNIRGSAPQDPCWMEAQAAAIDKFKTTGELPDDDLQIEAVLANVELDLLAEHKDGKDVAEALALLDKVQWHEGEELEAVMREVVDAAKAGRMR